MRPTYIVFLFSALVACSAADVNDLPAASESVVAPPAVSAVDDAPIYGARAVVPPDDCVVPHDRRLLAPLDEGGLAVENAKADALGLTRVNDLAALRGLISDGTLVLVESTEAYEYDATFAEHDPGNAASYGHALPTTKRFLDEVLGEGYRCFGAKFLLTSVTRTEKYQDRLKRKNRNAARGKTQASRSTHTTGATVDIGGSQLPVNVRNWLRHRLADLERAGLVQATEEHRRRSPWYCFHVMVYPDRWP